MAVRSIDIITFDLDDTLWDPRPAFVRAEQAQSAWLSAHAPRVTASHTIEDMRRLRLEFAARRRDIAHDFTRLRAEALRELLVRHDYDPSLADAGVAVFVRARSEVTLFDDARPALADLARDYTLVALTNGNADLEVAGVAEYFACCISPAEAGVQKPDPRMFEVALARVQAEPARAVHVGDQPLYDIEGAHRAALRAVWLNRNQSAWPAEYTRAAAEIATLAELRNALDRLERAP